MQKILPDEMDSTNAVNGMSSFHSQVHLLSRTQKRLILAASDFVLLSVSLWTAFLLRYGDPLSMAAILRLLPLFGVVSFGGVIVLWLTGFYQTLIRSFEFRTVYTLAGSVIVIGLLISLYAYLFASNSIVPRSVPAIFMFVAVVFIGCSRVAARWYYHYSIGLNSDRKNILIYGAGEAGNQVASLLSASREFNHIGFIDDDPHLQGSNMRGRRIYAPDKLERVIERYKDLRVVLSIGNISPNKRRQLIQSLDAYDLEIDILPSLTELVAGKRSLEDLREVRIEDLLGRDIVPPIDRFFSDAIDGKTVMVTGAAGSIGSELCRQICINNPAKLCVVDHSELGLYELEQDISQRMADRNGDGFEIEYILGSVNDLTFVKRMVAGAKPELVFHAAAYKHVPIVEDNVLAGVRNNVLGTWNMATICMEHDVERFILVSTDKAVRPTNVMGATKRAAELVVQALASVSKKTIFSMVRFGNVMGSSGSVIPLFQKQIAKNGPVTVTHKDVTRYFMTIPEAAQLVIQAGFLAKGGDVFVLDMGDPVKIQDVARLLIQLSGYTVQDEDNPNGEIEIRFSGLRPGEKLYEELLIDPNATGTDHPKIMVAKEKALKFGAMEKHIKTFEKSIQNNDVASAIDTLAQIVDGFDSRRV